MNHYSPLTIKNFLSVEECEYIMNEYGIESKFEPSKISNGVSNNNVRKSSVSFIENIDFIDKRLKDVLDENIKMKGSTLTGLSAYQLTKYEHDNFYDWHTDYDDIHNKNRFCSIVIQLNKGYSGGHLQYRDENGQVCEFEEGQGNLFVFFSILEHRVTPVTEGVRYSLVNWVSLERIPNFKKTIL